MKYQVLNSEPLTFYNSSGIPMGKIYVSSSGDFVIFPTSGSSRDIILGDRSTAGDVEIGLPSAQANLKLMGGGTISSNGNTLIIGNTATGDKVQINNTTFSQSMSITGSLTLTGSLNATKIYGSAYSLTDLTVDGTTRTLYTSASIVYSNNLPAQVTQSFDGGTRQITNITYSGTDPTVVEVTGSDSVNKRYAFTYSGGNITEIRVT